MIFVMKKDKAFDPSGISALDTICIVFQAHNIAYLIQEFSRFLLFTNFLIFKNKMLYLKMSKINNKYFNSGSH